MDLSGFSDYLLNRGLAEKTRQSYRRVLLQSDGDLIGYLRSLVRRQVPVGTMQPAKAAVRHYLHWSGQDALLEEIPKYGGRRQGQEAIALSPEQLAAYVGAVGGVSDPDRTVLLLLPLTGLRIGEVCKLQHGNVKQRGERVWLEFRGKGDKPRKVPLGATGRAVLAAFVGDGYVDPDVPLFSGLKPPRIRRILRGLRAEHDDLPDTLTPHTLRHTYATRTLAAGMDLARLMTLLGHGDISITQRYLHPTVEDLDDAVSGIEGL